MNKVYGKKSDFALLRVDASRTIIGFGLTEIEDGYYNWYEVYIYKKQRENPSPQEIKQAVIAAIDEDTREKILNGFVYEGKPVYLSQDNQRNFATALSFATFPFTFKLGEQENGTPVYHTFEAQEELSAFCTEVAGHIQACLTDGWTMKDSISWKGYGVVEEKEEE